ncbi:hypothetical protein TNCV_1800001 [Trichonephila clavipes]|nr:hypothetical protein TNCV_1800001 [Trichonephila clavipes]
MKKNCKENKKKECRRIHYIKTREYGTTPLGVKEDIEDASNTAVRSHWDSVTWKTKAETDRLSGIRLWDYKRENLEYEGRQDASEEKSSKEATGPRGSILPDMTMIKQHEGF